jgi:hypothetical protein
MVHMISVKIASRNRAIIVDATGERLVHVNWMLPRLLRMTLVPENGVEPAATGF